MEKKNESVDLYPIDLAGDISLEKEKSKTEIWVRIINAAQIHQHSKGEIK